VIVGSPEELISRYFRERAIQFTLKSPPSKSILEKFPGTTNVTVDNNSFSLAACVNENHWNGRVSIELIGMDAVLQKEAGGA
jgi:hypothetical protein